MLLKIGNLNLGKIFFLSAHCRSLRFTNTPMHGYRLNNHTIRTTDVIKEDICKMKCYQEPNCVSYNFKKKTEDNRQHKCDLNNATYEHDNEHSGDLVYSEDYVYRGAQVRIKDCKYFIEAFY